ncbi:uncharacterized protein LOC129596440 isoform X2 [Paramacrobiotus metropolitanus]|uniref:uncharacterized protein LOC129596440 isoform X2 n=1 Tax=Paramacrobiotus metropolitanus TaxID=2943436 RepID=UPI0024464CFC|nr:uncharacterized protein LOC129596440 isoform X2 [Paramacrobiotus metropolitanus]
MELGLLPRVSRHPLIAGTYDRFIVDILGDNATYRGYVCGVDSDHCMVRVGAMQQLQRIPMGKLYLPDPEEAVMVPPDGLIEKDIEVLVSVNENEPESWQPVSSLDGKSNKSFLLGTVKVHRPDNMVKFYRVLDGGGRAFRCLRYEKSRGPPVTPQLFRQVQIPLSEITSPCLTDQVFRDFGDYFQKNAPFTDSTAGILERIREFSFFQSLFVKKSRDFMFLGILNGCIDILVSQVKRSYTDYDIPRLIVIQDRFFKRFKPSTAVNKAVRCVLEEILTIVPAQHESKDPNDVRFDDLYAELILMIFAYLEVYDQHQLRRTCNIFCHLLFSDAIQQSVILPYNPDHITEVLSIYTSRGEDCEMAYKIGNSVTKNTKVLYFVGDRKERLRILYVLKAFDMKLDWLVIANNTTLLLNEFLPFPDPEYMLFTKEDNYVIVSFWEAGVMREFRAGRSSLRCCKDPFFITILNWHYSFTESVQPKFETAFQTALEKFCPEMENNKFENLVQWLDSLTDEDLDPKNYIWPFILLIYGLWNEELPKCLADVKRDISTKFPRRSLMVQTLALLFPCNPGMFGNVADTATKCKDLPSQSDPIQSRNLCEL